MKTIALHTCIWTGIVPIGIVTIVTIRLIEATWKNTSFCRLFQSKNEKQVYATNYEEISL